MMRGALFEVRAGVRRLVQRPWWSLAIVLSLALGIGFGTTVASFLQALVWTPLTSFDEPERVVAIFQEPLPGQPPAGPRNPQISLPVYRHLAESDAFASVAARQFLTLHLSRPDAGSGTSRKAIGELVTAGYFRTAGAEMVLGRPFLAEEDEVPGRDAVVVLAHHAWRERYGADPDVLGREVLLGGHSFEIVGVAEPGFVGASRLSPSDFWVPLAAHPWVFPYSEMIGSLEGRVLRPLARLAPGVEVEVARARLTDLAALLALEFPAVQQGQTLTLRPLAGGERSAFEEGMARRGTVALGMAGVLLLLACANTANLLLVRSQARQRQTAIQAALGAGTGRLVLQHLVDSLLLALGGGVAGWLLAVAVRRLLWSMRPPYLPDSTLDTGFDPGLLAVSLGLAAAAGLATAVVPMWSSRRPSLTSVLQEESQGAVARRGSVVPGSLLLAFEVALCTVALAVASLFITSAREARSLDPGFERQRLVVAAFDFHGTETAPEAVDRLRREMVERLAALPGAVSVATGENWPLGGFRIFRAVAPGGVAPEEGTVSAGSSLVDARYFDTVGIPLLTGRGFAPAELAAPATVVVNRTLAQRLWPGAEALGRALAIEGLEGPATVVGVAADSAMLAIDEEPQPFVYLPLTPAAQRFSLHVRTAGDPGALLAAVRRTVAETAPQLPLEDVSTVAQILDRSLWVPRLSALLLTVVGLCALILAAVGVYGIAAVQAARRQREVGVRLALGEARRRLVGRVVFRSMTAVVAGLAAGLLLSFWVSRSLSGLLYEAGEVEWQGLLAVALVSFTVALVANLLPVLRATRRDPVEVLRAS